MPQSTDPYLKRKILNAYKKNPNVQELAKNYGVCDRTIYRWLKREKPINWDICWFCEKPSKKPLIKYKEHKVHKDCLKSIENLSKYQEVTFYPRIK